MVSHSRFEETHVTYTTNQRAAVEAMATPADRALAIEVVNERIRRQKICEKLTEQSEVCEELRRVGECPRISAESNEFVILWL